MIGLFALFLNQGTTDEYIFPQVQYDTENFLFDEINGGTYYVRRCVLSKFPEDKLFSINNNIFICSDAVFLNTEDMVKKHSATINSILYNAYYNNHLMEVINEIRGIFSGVIINTKEPEICVFTDHLASKPVFYMMIENGIIVASEVYEIARFCRLNHIHIHLSLAGAYAMLSYGYMYNDFTLVEEIKRIREGTVLYYANGKSRVETYHRITAEPIPIAKEEAIMKIDKLFRKALELEVNKNKLHQYENIIPLSAGMDCRMTSYVFQSMYNQHAINFTYSETGEYDFAEPAKMASELHHRWIFKSLDNGMDLYNIDESIKLSDGLIYYAWPAQLGDFLKLVNTRQWGIIHTGVLGDVVLGTYKKNSSYVQYHIGDGAFSTKMLNKLKKYLDKKYLYDEQINYEVGMIQNRGINGVCLGYSLTFRHYAEDLSPFLNIDFLDFCLSIPVEMRYRHDLYYAWVERFYPEAKKYKHNGVSIKGNKKIRFHGKEYRICAIPGLLTNIIRAKINPNYGMNPFQAWYDNNSELRATMEDYYTHNKCELENWKELANDAEELFMHGDVKEKIQVISLLGSIKLMFKEEKS